MSSMRLFVRGYCRMGVDVRSGLRLENGTANRREDDMEIGSTT